VKQAVNRNSSMVSKRRSGGLTVFFVLFIFLSYHYGTHSTMKSMRTNHFVLFSCVVSSQHYDVSTGVHADLMSVMQAVGLSETDA